MTLARDTSLFLVALIAGRVSLCQATVLPACPDGTCAYPTIQAAINAAAPGDTVQLADGIYRGEGNRDLDYGGKAIAVRSESGDYLGCIIDCEGTVQAPHRGFYFHSLEGVGSVLEGVTVRGGYATEYGGGILCYSLQSASMPTPTIRNCRFTDSAAPHGGGVAVVFQWTGKSPQLFSKNLATLTACVVDSNVGSGLYLAGIGSQTVATNCSFSDNRDAGVGIGGMFTGYSGGVNFAGCQFLRNGGDGFSRGGMFTSANLDSCVITDNGNVGVGSYGNQDDKMNISSCTILRNGRGGVYKSTMDNSMDLTNCNISWNHGFGLCAGIEVYGFTVENCSITDNDGDGISDKYTGIAREARALPAKMGRASIGGCVISRNGGYGINLAFGAGGPGTFIGVSGCVVYNNGVAGIRFAAGVDDPMTSVVAFDNLTVVGNGGGGLVFASPFVASLQGSIVAFNQGPGIVYESGALPAISCTDIFGNTGGDWTPEIADQIELPGNFSGNPCFCDLPGGVLTLSSDSWCLPGRYPWGCGGLVGALGEGCAGMGCAPVVPVLVTDFVARVEDEGIVVSWRMNGYGDAGELRLLGSVLGREWDVPFEAAPGGSFGAVDRKGLMELGSARDAGLAYVLQMAVGSGWTPLGRQEVVGGDAPELVSLTLEVAPNPFNPRTTIGFDLPATGQVRLAM